MTASATWWKAATAALGLPLLLAGCSSVAALGGFSGAPQRGQVQRLASAPALNPASADRVEGLTPLPSARQVLAAVGIGRLDPFAPLAPGSGTGQVAAVPPGFLFSGVVRSGSQVQALVQFGSVSGSLSVGEVGGRTTQLLPPGWRVVAVDGKLGRLSLGQGSQIIRLDL